jgi:hypothetical protein
VGVPNQAITFDANPRHAPLLTKPHRVSSKTTDNVAQPALYHSNVGPGCRKTSLVQRPVYNGATGG